MSAQPSAARNRELSLLILALLLGCGAVALAALARSANAIDGALPLMVLLTVFYIGAHLMMRRFAAQADPLLLPLAAVLNSLGVAAIYRLSPEKLGPTQVTWTLVGLGCFVATLLIIRDYRILARYKYILGFIGVGLLLLPMTPLGRTINGARLWVQFGSFRFQPGELAKVCLVIFIAAYLADRKELLAIASRRIGNLHFPDIKHFGPLLVMWGLSLCVMFFEKDLGSSLLFFSIFLVMLYVATARLSYVGVGSMLFVVGAYFGYNSFSHVKSRVQVWLDVFNPRFIQDEGYQLSQSLFAMATGGLFGTGLGRGRPDLIPEAETDFIFSVIGEELGLLGTAGVLVCFMLIVARGLRASLRTEDDFGQLLAAGLIAIFAIQTIIIIGGVTRALPLTGITLPFMSYGGSSLLSNFILIGLLVRISHQSATTPDPARTAEILIGKPSGA